MFKILKKGSLGGTYHVTNEKMYSIKNIIKIICKSMNVEYEKNIISTKDNRVKIRHMITNEIKNTTYM